MQKLSPIEINEICEELGENYPKSIEQVHGGDIHNAWRIEFSNKKMFLKRNIRKKKFLEFEKYCLQNLRKYINPENLVIPKVITYKNIHNIEILLIESHTQAGGCAGTFKRKNYIFDVGATQVAGLEKGGIHSRIFDFLDIPSPEATILDPACIVDLNDGSNPIPIWYEKRKWIAEREMQFPGSQRFWKLCTLIHESNWIFANNNPVLPISNFWDFSQLLKAIVPSNLFTGILLKSTIFDLLRICGLSKNERLIKFLNLQLKLYSQEDVYSTAALYGSTVLDTSEEQ